MESSQNIEQIFGFFEKPQRYNISRTGKGFPKEWGEREGDNQME